MKIIALWNNYAGTASTLRPATVWLADSCLLREGRPFYVPDWVDDFQLFPSLAIRIDKVGKGIQPRFADRYWSQASAWLNARACKMADTLAKQGLPLDSAVAFDSSLITAPFFDLSPQDAAEFTFRLHVNDRLVSSWSAEDLRKPIQEVIASISFNTTLKTGDILLLGFPGKGIKVAPGDNIIITEDRNPDRVLNHFRIK
ncbi:MAG: fumarylacetoacetate hydrolase family protein [Muribaculaceae bacterium]|nr:fumarylacetoacetate hydrolase family protein [Muribaculaceae bacterium]